MSDWVDKHSVNCMICSKLVDERNCTPGPNGEGDICPACWQILGPVIRVVREVLGDGAKQQDHPIRHDESNIETRSE